MKTIVEILSNIAGCLGFVLSLCLVFNEWFNRRTKFDISVLDYNNHAQSVRFLLSVKNKSNAPLVISSISAFETICELEPKRIRNEPGSWNAAVSARFPVRVHSRDIENFYIEILTGSNIPLDSGTRVTFQIQTIGRMVRKTVLLGNRAHYLNKRC